MSSKITLGNRNNSSETAFESVSILRFAENRLLPLLYGEHDCHLARLEESFRVRISSRGNQVSIAGDETAVALGIKSLNALYRRLEKGLLGMVGTVEEEEKMQFWDDITGERLNTKGVIMARKEELR